MSRPLRHIALTVEQAGQERALLSACGLHQPDGGEAAANDPVAIDTREMRDAI